MSSYITKNKKRYVPDVSHLMAVCELNYVNLQRLFPAMHEMDQHHLQVSEQATTAQVSFTVQARAPYTTHLRIEQPETPWLPSWSLMVRIYHDARLAEVVECQAQPRIRAVNDYPNPCMHHPDEKMQWNLFLGEWLQHCLNCGLSAETIVAMD